MDVCVCLDALLRVITDFYRRDEVKKLCADQGLDIRLFQDAYVSFRKFCLQSSHLPVDLHIVFSDIISESGHVTDIFPYFLRHAREMFPHLTCMEDLKKISDLRDPANWWDERRWRTNERTNERRDPLGIRMLERFNERSSFMLDQRTVEK